MLSIVTLTMNPAVDESTSVPYVLSDRKLRCQAPTYEPGGGGINVARAIQKLGGAALACFPVAGPAGELLKRLLDAEGLRYTPMPVNGWTRENLNVLEEVSGRQFRFCMPGATLGDHEWPIFLDWVRQLRPAPDFLVASGSLPPGVPVDFYARLAAVGRQTGSRVVLDTSGAPLARAVEEGVYLLKPSLQEFHALMGEHEGDESHLGEPRGHGRQARLVRDPRPLARGGGRPLGDCLGAGAAGVAVRPCQEQRGGRRQHGGGHRALTGPGPRRG